MASWGSDAVVKIAPPPLWRIFTCFNVLTERRRTLVHRQCGRLTKSSSFPLRQHQQPHLATVQAFPVAGPQVWNSLPPEVTSAPSLDTFRMRLKAHLFTVSYTDMQLL